MTDQPANQFCLAAQQSLNCSFFLSIYAEVHHWNQVKILIHSSPKHYLDRINMTVDMVLSKLEATVAMLPGQKSAHCTFFSRNPAPWSRFRKFCVEILMLVASVSSLFRTTADDNRFLLIINDIFSVLSDSCDFWANTFRSLLEAICLFITFQKTSNIRIADTLLTPCCIDSAVLLLLYFFIEA